jgi:hypothetical protein
MYLVLGALLPKNKAILGVQMFSVNHRMEIKIFMGNTYTHAQPEIKIVAIIHLPGFLTIITFVESYLILIKYFKCFYM